MPTPGAHQGLITLTTDFGLSDHFVAVMKGVILGICPTAQIVDVTHDVEPFGISQGAFVISQTWPGFPDGTVHVVVVDPGVGTARRPILIEAHRQYFIGPDNGVLSMVCADAVHTAREITAEEYFLPNPSRTFHGRDIFAPLAAHLASGIQPDSVGPTITDHLHVALYRPTPSGDQAWAGSILHVDHFGNLITNFHIADFADVQTRPFEIAIGAVRVRRLALTFADADPGMPFAVVGSSGYLEIALNQASAARALGCGAGAPAELIYF